MLLRKIYVPYLYYILYKIKYCTYKSYKNIYKEYCTNALSFNSKPPAIKCDWWWTAQGLACPRHLPVPTPHRHTLQYSSAHPGVGEAAVTTRAAVLGIRGTQHSCLDTAKARAHCSLTCDQGLGPAHLPQQTLLPRAAGSCDPKERRLTAYLGLGANSCRNW